MGVVSFTKVWQFCNLISKRQCQNAFENENTIWWNVVCVDFFGPFVFRGLTTGRRHCLGPIAYKLKPNICRRDNTHNLTLKMMHCLNFKLSNVWSWSAAITKEQSTVEGIGMCGFGTTDILYDTEKGPEQTERPRHSRNCTKLCLISNVETLKICVLSLTSEKSLCWTSNIHCSYGFEIFHNRTVILTFCSTQCSSSRLWSSAEMKRLRYQRQIHGWRLLLAFIVKHQYSGDECKIWLKMQPHT